LNEIGQGFIQALQLIFSLNPDVVGITARSLYISLASVILASLVDVPLGALIELREFRGKRSLVNLIQTLYSLPTVTVGLLVFLFISRSGPLGGLNLLFTPGGMIIGQTILISPIIIGLTISSLRGVSSQTRETAKSLGATERQIIATVIKEARYAMVAALLLGFGRAISEVGVAMMIGGNIRGYTRVLTTAIALETSKGNLELSLALGIILISLSLLVSLLLSRFQGR
jgi:tungstate transport system permease protein